MSQIIHFFGNSFFASGSKSTSGQSKLRTNERRSCISLWTISIHNQPLLSKPIRWYVQIRRISLPTWPHSFLLLGKIHPKEINHKGTILLSGYRWLRAHNRLSTCKLKLHYCKHSSNSSSTSSRAPTMKPKRVKKIENQIRVFKVLVSNWRIYLIGRMIQVNRILPLNK